MKRFLVIQLRPEDEAADGEFDAFLAKGGLGAGQVRRIRLDRAPLPPDLRLGDYAGVVLGGGPGCVSDAPEAKDPLEARMEADMLSLMPEVTERDVPFLGCCAGIGVLALHLGAPVSKDNHPEPVGTSACAVTPEGRGDPLLAGLPERFDAFVGHKEALDALPPGCAHLLSSDACPFQMIRHGRNVYATQFHPEADADVFESRIRIYADRGYFDPSDADRLIALCRAADVAWPERILRNFVARYA